jgi:hypothetical protein
MISKIRIKLKRLSEPENQQEKMTLLPTENFIYWTERETFSRKYKMSNCEQTINKRTIEYIFIKNSKQSKLKEDIEMKENTVIQKKKTFVKCDRSWSLEISSTQMALKEINSSLAEAILLRPEQYK